MMYGKMHRFFLRTVASQGVLSIVDAQTILERFSDEEQLSLTDLVKAINDEIRPYYQEMKITKDEVTNEDVIVFLSLADDAATKAQNIFTSTELEYFRLLIEHIMSTESRQITRINAINVVGSMKSSFTKTDAEKVLNTWCRMRYFDKEQDNYALGVRAIHEFETYFRQNMQHAVEDCFLCKHIVFRGYNCPGCAQAVHTRCLKRYLERVQKWPCCKLDFKEEQLERLNNEGSRLQQTQQSDTSRHSEENNTVAELTQVSENSEIMDESQDTVPGISQRLSRKRKREISPAEVPSTSDNVVAKPAQVVTTRRSTDDTIVEEPMEVVTEATKVHTTRRSAKSTIAEEPTQVRTTRRGKNEPTPVQESIVEGTTRVPSTRRSTRNSTEAEPTQVLTHRSKKDTIVEEPTQVRTTRRGIKNEPTQVTTRHSKMDSIVEETTNVPSTRRARNNAVPEPISQVQESFENLDVTDKAKPEVSQRATRKRKPQ